MLLHSLLQFQQQNYVKVLGLHNNFTLNSAEYEGKPPQELHQGALDSTSVSTHCHCCNFLVSFQFSQKIYQGQKSSHGAWLIL